MTVAVRTPTPPIVYEPRIWAVRIFTKDNPFIGTGFLFKAPYGVYMNALQTLGRAEARFQITRFAFGPATSRQIDAWGRKNLERYEEAFERVGLSLAIDWAA